MGSFVPFLQKCQVLRLNKFGAITLSISASQLVNWVHFKLVASSLPLKPRPVRSLPLVLLPLRGEGEKSGFQVPSPLVGVGIQGCSGVGFPVSIRKIHFFILTPARCARFPLSIAWRGAGEPKVRKG